MKPYKVYYRGKLFDIVYAQNGTSVKTLKTELVAENKWKLDEVRVTHFINIRR